MHVGDQGLGNEQGTKNKEKSDGNLLHSDKSQRTTPHKDVLCNNVTWRSPNKFPSKQEMCPCFSKGSGREREDEQMQHGIGQIKLTVTANSEGPPYIVDETEDYAIVFKPPRMHCAPQSGPQCDLLQSGPLQSNRTLFDWYAAIFPAVANIAGRKQGGGLLHRLDFETQGLTLFAKKQSFADELLTQQRNGNFIKEYSAICVVSARKDSSFPPLPAGLPPLNGSLSSGFGIESFFRPYGPGRKQVRPVIEAQAAARYEIASCCYRTEIVNVSKTGDMYAFTLRLARGFRHQIRCHLAWIGFPIANDPLYGVALRIDLPCGNFLALRASVIAFTDLSGKVKECRIEPLFESLV
jgi:23S rRNA pseudouridine1911/1915/1917 synthase